MRTSRLMSHGNSGKRLAILAFLAAVLAAAFAPAAQAAPGLITTFGERGTGPGQFFYAGPTAVDGADGNLIFVTDYTEAFDGRLREFDSSGTELGSAAVSSYEHGEELIDSIAVDESEHRVYVLLAGVAASGEFAGQPITSRILAYSTTPNASGELVPAPGVTGGVLYNFTTSVGGLYDPQAMAVDPGTHKLVIAGETEPSVRASSVLLYVTDAGALSTEVTGLIAAINPSGGNYPPIASIAVGPDGTVYFPFNWQSSATGASEHAILSTPRESTNVTRFTTGSEELLAEEGAVNGFQGLGGSLAVSSDGLTLFVGEVAPGGFTSRVRAYSITTGKQRYLYEGGECEMPRPSGMVALGAGKEGFLAATTVSGEAEGAPVVHVFGDNGVTACPSSSISATMGMAVNPSQLVEGLVESPTITKGESRNFTINPADLHGDPVAEVDWDFNGDGIYETQVSGGEITIKHKFTTTGTFHVGAKVILNTEPGQEVVTNSESVEVSPLAPTASFKVSTKSPLTGEAVTFDASESRDLTGGPEGEAVKLGETGTYRWDFGDGSTLQTTKPITTHAFSTAGAHTVKLTVVSHEGLTSATPFTVAVTAVAPTPPPGDGGGGGGETTPPPSTTPPTTTPPVTTPPTTTPKVLTCKKGFVKTKGKCVKKSSHHKKKKKAKK